MFDISKLDDHEILDYRLDYMIRNCLEDIQSFCFEDFDGKADFCNELYSLLLKYDPYY